MYEPGTCSRYIHILPGLLEEPEQFLFQETGNQIYKEPDQFLFQEVGNQIYKVLERSGSGTQVLGSELALVKNRWIDH